MRHVKILTLAAVAAFALAAIASASASAALPELYECVTTTKVSGKYTGKYLDKKCSKEATAKEITEGKKNKYELTPGYKGKSGKPFKGSGHGANLEANGIGGIACTSFSDSGKFTSTTTAGDVVAVFKGCEYIGLKCASTGAKAGEIKTNPLTGTVGYLAGKGTPTPTVGASLTAESGPYLAVFKCQNEYFWVTGAVIGEVSPVNKFTKEATFTFKQAGIGKQEWTKFEGGPTEVLEVTLCSGGCANPSTEGIHASAAEETVATNKGEELELKA